MKKSAYSILPEEVSEKIEQRKDFVIVIEDPDSRGLLVGINLTRKMTFNLNKFAQITKKNI